VVQGDITNEQGQQELTAMIVGIVERNIGAHSFFKAHGQA